MISKEWFYPIAAFFGWTPQCIGGCHFRYGEYDCDAPDCLVWKFRPDLTS